MTTLVSDAYRDLNASFHRNEPDFGRGGHMYADLLAPFLRNAGVQTVLDYGCGKGTLKPALQKLLPGIDVREYDPAIPAKSAPPSPAQVVVSLDVMEHIEPDCIDAVLDHIRSLALNAVFLVISTKPAMKNLPDGRNAHLIVQPSSWWRERLDQRFTLVHQDPAPDGAFLYLATPK